MSSIAVFLVVPTVLFAWLGRLLGRWLPRFSAAFAGPGLMVFAACMAIFHREPFDVSGSSAIPFDPTPLVYGLLLILLALMGLIAWVTGWRRRLPDPEPEVGASERSPETDFSRYVPGESSWLTPWRIVMVSWIFLVLLAIGGVAFARVAA